MQLSSDGSFDCGFAARTLVRAFAPTEGDEILYGSPNRWIGQRSDAASNILSRCVALNACFY